LLQDPMFFNSPVEKNFQKFVNNCDVIIANRISKELNPYMDKVYTKDLFGKD